MRYGRGAGAPGRRPALAGLPPQPEVTPVAIFGVHHVDLVVRSVERSLPFYRDLLGPLGWHGISEVEGERGETIWYLSGPGTSIGIRAAQPSQIGPGYDRYSVGLHHLAFEAQSRSVVDERADGSRSTTPTSRVTRRSTATRRATTRSSSTTLTG